MDIFLKNDLLAEKSGCPVSLFPNLLEASDLARMADALWTSEDWEDRGAPRRECFYSALGKPYTYGSGAGMRTYWPKTYKGLVADLTGKVERFVGCKFELCFMNGYAGPREHLGWHADDSDEIDDSRPIAVMSLGAEREIWLRERGSKGEAAEKILLPNGSLFLMKAGMQDTHDHRIPKAGRDCGFRISLTWRGAAA